MFRKSVLSQLISASLLLGSGTVAMAGEPVWDCRVSADGATWDCYKDGNLVVQPMPQSTVTAPASETVAEEVSVPDSTESAVSESDTPQQTETDLQAVEKELAAEKSSDTSIQTESAGKAADAMAASTTAAAMTKAEKQQSSSASAQAVAQPEFSSTSQTVEVADTAGQSEAPIAAQPEYCLARPAEVKRPSTEGLPEETFIEADDAVFNDNSSIADFKGNVSLTKLDQLMQADMVTYNNQTADAHAEGNFRYRRPDLELDGTSADMNLNTDKGEIYNAVYRMPANNARGTSDQINLLGDGRSTYNNVSYTTCEQGKDDWVFSASELTLDQNTGVGEATHMTLEFMDVPIAYFPYATFPIDNRRKSGFLIPSYGSSDLLGVDISAPYYFNLAPNYDATLTPRYMSDRGLQLGGEFRYLNEYSYTELYGEILPEDDGYVNNNVRGGVRIKNNSNFGNNVTGFVEYADVSDDTYLEDFGGSLSNSSTTYLKQQAGLNYSGDGYSIRGEVLQYEQLAGGSETYRKLPQVRFNGSHDFNIADSEFIGDLIADYTYFDHRNAVAKGGRLDLMPSIEYDWRRSWGFIKPKGTLRYTNYDLKDHTYNSQDVGSVDRTTATFSLDSGLIFERDTSWFGTGAVQTLEPRLFYVYTPEENQDDIPLFDTGYYTFSSASLFRENRFSGSDRVGDANQMTLAVSSRYLSEETGKQYLMATFGAIAYFEDRNVQLNPNSATETLLNQQDNSSYVLALQSTPANNWIADAGLQIDEDFADVERGSVRLKYSDAQRHLFSARYEYDNTTATENEYTKISAYWPIAYNTRLIGHSYYSLSEGEAIESVAGLEYGSSCCWRIRALARDYRIDTNESNLGFFLQLELSGFTQIGDDVDSFLEETIEGFVRESY